MKNLLLTSGFMALTLITAVANATTPGSSTMKLACGTANQNFVIYNTSNPKVDVGVLNVEGQQPLKFYCQPFQQNEQGGNGETPYSLEYCSNGAYQMKISIEAGGFTGLTTADVYQGGVAGFDKMYTLICNR